MRTQAKKPVAQVVEDDDEEELSDDDEVSNDEDSEEDDEEGDDASDDSDEVDHPQGILLRLVVASLFRFLQDESDDEDDDAEKLRASLADIPFEVLQVLHL